MTLGFITKLLKKFLTKGQQPRCVGDVYAARSKNRGEQGGFPQSGSERFGVFIKSFLEVVRSRRGGDSPSRPRAQSCAHRGGLGRDVVCSTTRHRRVGPRPCCHKRGSSSSGLCPRDKCHCAYMCIQFDLTSAGYPASEREGQNTVGGRETS